MVVEIRDWCQNVGEYNTYNFCIWHFGLCVIVSKIDRCRSSDPPYEIAINPIFRSYRVSDVIIQSFLNRSRWNLVHTLVERRARSAISDCLVCIVLTMRRYLYLISIDRFFCMHTLVSMIKNTIQYMWHVKPYQLIPSKQGIISKLSPCDVIHDTSVQKPVVTKQWQSEIQITLNR